MKLLCTILGVSVATLVVVVLSKAIQEVNEANRAVENGFDVDYGECPYCAGGIE